MAPSWDPIVFIPQSQLQDGLTDKSHWIWESLENALVSHKSGVGTYTPAHLPLHVHNDNSEFTAASKLREGDWETFFNALVLYFACLFLLNTSTPSLQAAERSSFRSNLELLSRNDTISKQLIGSYDKSQYYLSLRTLIFKLLKFALHAGL